MAFKIPILLYHDLESPDYPNEKTNPAARDTVLDVKQFEAQIHYLAENGYETISLENYFELKKNIGSLTKKKIIITFDDGHYSNYHLAVHILKKYGFKATFFIIADRIGQTHHLAEEQIRGMSEMGMGIGSHGLTHKYLPLMDNGAIEYELRESKKILESVTKQPVEFFAFPGGHYNRDILKLLAPCGYRGACSCLQGLNEFRANPYLLKRIEIRRRYSIDEFRYIFNPVHIAFYQFIDLWKSMIRRLIGLEKYSRIRSRLYKFYIFKR